MMVPFLVFLFGFPIAIGIGLFWLIYIKKEVKEINDKVAVHHLWQKNKKC